MNRKKHIMDRENDLFIKISSIVLVILFMLFASVAIVNALPQGPTITFNSTQNVTPRQAAQLTTAGGSFTTIVLNATTQTPRWKAYVGNVSGKLALEDANVRAIFDWSLTSVTGEVYATRNSSVDWSTITCANNTMISTEETSLNMTSTNADTINKTFINRVHRAFYVGATRITNSTCPAVATYVNGTNQSLSENASFQEILLMDNSQRMLYSTLINQNTTGFNGLKYDFQMIVAEDEFKSSPSTYYLYVELI